MNNILILIGRITRNIELKYTNSNKPYTNINLAVNNGKEDTSFIDVKLFNNLAQTVSKYCKKGDLIGIQGMVKNNNWEDNEGKKHYDYTFIANKVTFLHSSNKDIKNKSDGEIVRDLMNSDDPFREINGQFSLDDLDLNDSLPF